MSYLVGVTLVSSITTGKLRLLSWIFKSRCHCRYRESPPSLNDRCWWFFSDSEVVQESHRESLFRYRFFVSSCGIDSGSCIGKRFKDTALDKQIIQYNLCIKSENLMNIGSVIYRLLYCPFLLELDKNDSHIKILWYHP